MGNAIIIMSEKCQKFLKNGYFLTDEDCKVIYRYLHDYSECIESITFREIVQKTTFSFERCGKNALLKLYNKLLIITNINPKFFDILIGFNFLPEFPNDRTLLHEASIQGSYLLVPWLIEKDFDVNAKDDSGNTPIHLALLHDRKRVAKQLITHGAKMDEPNKNGDTPKDFFKYGSVLN